MAKTRQTASPPTVLTKKKAKVQESDEVAHVATSPIQHICRTCLEEIQANNLIPLNDSSSNIRNELRACIPEVDFDLVPNAGMCMFCLNALHVAYEFKQKCLQTEDKIRKQLHRKLLIDLTKLKKPSSTVEVSKGEGLGLDVVYINDPLEMLESEMDETVNHFVSQTSTPLLDEEIEMINSTACNEDSFDEMQNGDDKNNETDSNLESNLLLGLSESAPRRISIENTVVSKATKPKKAKDVKVDTETKTDSSHGSSEKDVFICGICKESIETVNSVVEHMKQHDKKLFNCNRCPFTAHQNNSFTGHMRMCKKGKTDVKANTYKCSKCDFVATVESILKKHVRNCSTPTPIIKPSSVTKKTKDTLKINLKAKEKVRVLIKRQITQRKESTPSPVNSVMRINAYLKEVFGDINEYICRFCEFTTDEPAKYELHVTADHNNEFPYNCKDNQCPFISRTRGGYMAHMTYHYGDRPYRCTLCTYQCATSGHLQIHIKRHPVPKTRKWKRSY